MNIVLRKVIQIDEEMCDGCGHCVLACAEGALQIIDGKAKVISETFCDGLGACIGECPTGALSIVEREAAPFDEEAVKESAPVNVTKTAPVHPRGCPSTELQILRMNSSPSSAGKGAQSIATKGGSSLSHWPIQIRLIPATAPFLKHADLLVIADCTAVAFPIMHCGLAESRVVMMGCPKFDDVRGYAEKFREIFEAAGIKSVTAVIMEVPCCYGLPAIIKNGMKMAKKSIPMEVLVVNARGEISNKVVLHEQKTAEKKG